MNSEKEVRDFYEEEAEYEKSILLTKELVEKVISVDINIVSEKINFLKKDSEFGEFPDLLNAVIGRETNKYYYCENIEEVKYYNLEVGKVYKISELNPDIQSKNSIKKQLNLQARAILAQKTLPMAKYLKEIFCENIQRGDGSISTIDSRIITENDVEYLENLIKYLEIMIDKTGRLKILVAERDVYALKKAKEDYNKKSSVEKWFYKTFKKEKSVINNMAQKRK